MHYRLFALLALFVIALSVPAAPAAEGQDTAQQPAGHCGPGAVPCVKPPPNFMGMVVRDPYYEWNLDTGQVRKNFIDAMMDDLGNMGVKWVRFEFHALYSGDFHGYGSFEMRQADYFIEAAHRNNIKVLALISTDILKGPNNDLWNFNDYPVSQEFCDPGGNLGCGLTPYIQHWLTRALGIADYYRGRIDAYELLNEENIYYGLAAAREAAGKSHQVEMDPIRVARMIAKFFRVQHSRGDPTPIILGGLHPRSAEPPACKYCTMQRYLRAMYESQNEFQAIKKRFGRWPIDGVAYHPYPQEIPTLLGNDNQFLYRVPGALQGLINLIREYDGRSKLWITEIGSRGRRNGPADLTRQADFLRRFYRFAWFMREHIYTVMWFKQEGWHPNEQWGVNYIPYVADDPNTPVNECGSYPSNPCLYSADRSKWVRKPSFHNYKHLALEGFPELKVVYLPSLKR